MITKNPKSYSGSQELLVTICLAAWILCGNFLEFFAAFGGYYTPGYVADQVAAIKAAKALPGSKQTIGDRKLARIALSNASKQVLKNWQLLKQYIINAYNADQVNAQLLIAGESYYHKAAKDDWSSMRSLIETGLKFIEANSKDLSAHNNMPIDFPAAFQADCNTCTAASETFFADNLAKKQAIKIKREAYIAFYTTTITMLKNAQIIFKDNPVVKSQFSFAAIKSSYAGGSASLYGTITNDNGLPVEGATVISKDQKYKATSKKDGKYRISRIAEGAYLFSCNCPGYVPVDQSITFEAGIKSKSDVKLAFSIKKVA